MSGLAGGADRPGIVPMYAVADVHAAARMVRELGGQAAEPVRQPFGRSAECVDDQGYQFSLHQP